MTPPGRAPVAVMPPIGIPNWDIAPAPRYEVGSYTNKTLPDENV